MNYFYLFLLSFLSISFTACEKAGNSSQEEEKDSLENLYKEIEELSISVVCEDAEEWDFTAIGSKACGGPTGYLAYSSGIDTEDFLKKVALYTELQDQYNKKWGIISDCMALMPPNNVECVDGKPKLIYENLNVSNYSE